MPVDDQLLEDKIQELNVVITDLHRQRKELETITRALRNITKYEEKIHETDEDGNPTIRVEMRIPKDKSLGVEISVARRQQIYDSMIAKADALLNA